MTAGVVAIGSELLGPGRMDGNGEWLTSRLEGLGVEVRLRAVVDDDLLRIGRVLRAGLDACDLTLSTGGLGPTEDDRTREAAALALGVSIERDAAQESALRALFARFGRPWHAVQARQADRPLGAEWITNPVGSAPGFEARREGRRLVCLPGVPAEMRAMFDASVAPPLERTGRTFARRALRIAGVPEAVVEQRVRDLYAEPGVEVTILAGPARGVELLLRAEGNDAAEADRRLAIVEGEMTLRLGEDLYGRDDETLAGRVGLALASRGLTVATAESCTAGMLAAALTDVPGSSAWFRGGVVAYSDDLKVRLAAVPPALLEAHGAVSEEVARALARGAITTCGANLGVGVTGIAGPGGGSPEKPVGLVHLAVSDGTMEHARRLLWPGDRESIRRRSVTAALDLLRRVLASR